MKWLRCLGSVLGFSVLLSLAVLSFTLGLRPSMDGEPSASSPAGSSLPIAANPSTPSTLQSVPSPGSWQAIALAACVRHGCDGQRLLALGTVETLGNPDCNDVWHRDKVSWGCFGMQVDTAVRWFNPGWFVTGHRPHGHEAVAVELALMDPAVGPDLAAQQLAWCERRPFVRRARNKTWAAAICWNSKDQDYPHKVWEEYKRLKKDAAVNQRIAYAKGAP